MLGRHPRAVHNQRAGGRIEKVVAHAEAVGGPPRFGRIVANFECRVQRARARVEPDIGRKVGGVHVYSHAGITLPHRAGLPAHRVYAVAAQFRTQAVALQQMQNPAELGMRLVAELARLQPRHFEAGILQQLMDLARRVFAIVPRIHLARALRRTDVGVKESGMVALQDSRDAAQRGDIRRGQHQVAARLQDPVDLAHQVHRVFEEVLDQFAADHRGEVGVGIRKHVLLGIEVIDLAREGLAVRGCHRAMVAAAQFPVVAAAHFAVAEYASQRGSDLQIGAHLQHAIAGGAGRRDFQRLEQSRLMRIEILRRRLTG